MNKRHENFDIAKLAVIVHKNGSVSTHKSITEASRSIGIEPAQGHDIVRGRADVPNNILVMTRHRSAKIEKNDIQVESDKALAIFNKFFDHYEADAVDSDNGCGTTGKSFVINRKGKHLGWEIVFDDGSVLPADTIYEIANLFGCAIKTVSFWAKGERGIPKELGISAVIRNGFPNTSWVSKHKAMKQWL